MKLSFNRQDLENWAEFSGDRNPIHFDLIEAKKLGCDNLVVHGMLVLNELLSHIQAAGSDGWQCIKSVFKNPVQLGQCCHLETKVKESKTSLTLSVDNKTAIKSQFYLADPEQIKGAKIELSAKDTVTSKSKFRSLFVGNHEEWHWLNAWLFSIFIKELLPGIIADFKGDFTEEAIAVQTSHKIYFKPVAIQKLSNDLASTRQLSVNYDVVENLREEYRSTGEVNLAVSNHGDELFVQSIGILISHPKP